MIPFEVNKIGGRVYTVYKKIKKSYGTTLCDSKVTKNLKGSGIHSFGYNIGIRQSPNSWYHRCHPKTYSVQ